MHSKILKLQIGNDYEFLSEEDSSLSRDGQYLKRNKFTLFANVVEGDASLLRGVNFVLHPSFSPQEWWKEVAPFKTTQTCYGFFSVQIELHFYRKAPEIINWDLCFDGTGRYEEFFVQGGEHGTLEDIPVPQSLTFGVELELTLPQSIQSHQQLAERLQDSGFDARAVGYMKAVTPYWKICTDASICCSRDNANCVSCEFVSPILRGEEGLHQISVLFGLLSQLGASVNSSAGFHVHVGSAGFSFDALKKICANFVKFEQAFDSLVPASRRGVNNKFLQSHQYQHGLRTNGVINSSILNCKSRKELQRNLNGPNGNDRYFKLNIQRLGNESPTIEFRQHSGTASYPKIRAWVLLLLHFCANSESSHAPDNFAPERSATYQRDRLFQWLIKQPILESFYANRAFELKTTTGEGWWSCACGKAFGYCGRLIQHQSATGHGLPRSSCCDECGTH